MFLKVLVSGPKHLPWVVSLLVAFTLAGTIHYTTDRGGDLGPSYVACRLMVSHETEHLYAYDPKDFSEVGPDAAWERIAAEGHLTGMLHPYVQTPLWASALAPLCARTSFKSFARVFALLEMASFAGILWLVGRYWTPELLNPCVVGLILLLLYLSIPFRFAMLMLQTHVLFLFMIVASLLLAERRRTVSAGLLLACAAAVKLTPGFLVVYWLLQRRWRAAASMAAWSAVLWLTTLIVDGRALVAAYTANLRRISETLLITDLNQSYASWVIGRGYPAEELAHLHSYPLPGWVKWTGTGLMFVCLVMGGLLDRRKNKVPLGAMIALVGAMLFSPIAWSHYFVLLMVPLMLLVHENLTIRSAWMLAGVGFVIALNCSLVDMPALGRFRVLHGSFYSGLVCLGLSGWAAWATTRRETLRQD